MNAESDKARAVELDIDCGRYPEIAGALAYWRRQKGDRALPARSDIDPLDLAPTLPRVMMVEVSHDPLDFRYRLAGTGVFALHGEELTGMRACDLSPPEFGALIHGHYTEAVRRRAPILHLIQLDGEEVQTSYARIILPLSGDGAAIDRLITVECYEENLAELQEFFEKK